ncbi:hypothetical protein NDU88_011546 [Pleurodeles waltl]|uniref:Uncharacterized protein n=1 Tax=Pleurodeles waltl TaxID=8319 RepID=A0AAV7S420_PLEWA|nr:hypothetical protein NDU88_011546 [Pleurodeles waltl]
MLVPVEVPSSAELLAGIQGLRVALEVKIETLAMEVNFLWTDLRNVSDKDKVAEGSIVELQTEVTTLRKQVTQLTQVVRLEDVDWRSPPWVPTDCGGVCSRGRCGTLDQRCAVTGGVIHHVRNSACTQGAGYTSSAWAPPRAIIVRILNYRDSDCIPWAAQETDNAVFENHKISIYPDFTNKVKTSRKGFIEGKAKLHGMTVCYMLLYPEHLKAISVSRSHFFDQLEEVQRWLEMWDTAPSGGSSRAHPASGGSGSNNWREHNEDQIDDTQSHEGVIMTALKSACQPHPMVLLRPLTRE